MMKRDFARFLQPDRQVREATELGDGARVAVMGGGPTGSFFSYFLLDLARRLETTLQVDIYEPRDFSATGPSGCNMCGGVISESFVQFLSAEGINLPSTVVQRAIDSYVLHTNVGSVRIETPTGEKRIGTVFRGTGPRDWKGTIAQSFDGYLLDLALKQGAHLIRERVTKVTWYDEKPQLWTKSNASQPYDLLVVAVGVNSAGLKLFAESKLSYQPPHTTKTFICEYYLGSDAVAEHLKSSMHVFLLNMPRLQFAAAIPKEDYVTVCMIGEEIDSTLIQSFLNSTELRQCMPPGWQPDQVSCQCLPRINVKSAFQPFGHRIVFIGDCGTNRLYKDGIGGGYRAAKAAASTAMIHGVSEQAFRKYYWPICRGIESDNAIGKSLFRAAHQIQKHTFARRAVLRMATAEQGTQWTRKPMSTVLWDIFSGSAPYREILLRILHPTHMISFLWNLFVCALPVGHRDYVMQSNTEGKGFREG